MVDDSLALEQLGVLVVDVAFGDQPARHQGFPGQLHDAHHLGCRREEVSVQRWGMLPIMACRLTELCRLVQVSSGKLERPKWALWRVSASAVWHSEGVASVREHVDHGLEDSLDLGDNGESTGLGWDMIFTAGDCDNSGGLGRLRGLRSVLLLGLRIMFRFGYTQGGSRGRSRGTPLTLAQVVGHDEPGEARCQFWIIFQLESFPNSAHESTPPYNRSVFLP